MRNVTASTSDVGLRQVVEDALQILRGVELEDDRGEFVVSDLKNLFESASRGSELAEEESLFLAQTTSQRTKASHLWSST